jgi:transcriptional regulator with XRE-family HTH domain
MSISERLKKFREHKKITMKQMAEMFDITVSGYGMYETGKRRLPVEDTHILFSMGCNLNWLIVGEGLMEWDEKIIPPNENELIKSLVKSNECSIKTAENCSEAVLSSTKTVENLSNLLNASSRK